ncbi:MAG: nicotinate phosphoribosyltransferase [Thermomicrobiales bacterium]|nr:nicotinate phosphoribosyltransferase [Thermomicrobiales bacterium]
MWQAAHLGGGLGVDLYHIDSAHIAWRSGLTAPATFDLYTRHAPFGGAYLLVAGLELALDYAANLHFDDDQIDYLRTHRPYDDAFLDHLREIRFTGESMAMPEGEIAFADEPLLRVTAPFIEALLLESGLLHTVGVSTLIATKAARIVSAAAGRPVAEFGYRRAQAPFLAARSGYIGGCASTSFLAAAHQFDLPATGTVPHALIEAFPSEAEAFRAIAAALEHYSLLLDTYDVARAIATAIAVAHESAPRGHHLASVRLDSGDVAADSRYVRQQLDAAGLPEVRVLASGDLDEWRIAALLAAGAQLDGFGVGTSLATGAGSVAHGVDGGALGAVYKIAWTEGEAPAPIKIAGEKSTWPGKKQVVRLGEFAGDLIQLDDEPYPANARPLLQPAFQGGARLLQPTLAEIRDRAASNLAALPARYREIEHAPSYPVTRSPRLTSLRDETIASHTQ